MFVNDKQFLNLLSTLPLRDDGPTTMVWARCRARINEDDNYCSYALKYILSPRSNVIKIYWFFFSFFSSLRHDSFLCSTWMRAGCGPEEGEPIGINDWHNSVHTRTTSHTFSLNKEGWEWWEAMKLLPYCQGIYIVGACLMSNEKCLVVCWSWVSGAVVVIIEKQEGRWCWRETYQNKSTQKKSSKKHVNNKLFAFS